MFNSKQNNRINNIVTLGWNSLTLPKRQSIAIIGGGFSGTMVAIHLLKKATIPLDIYLIERNSQLGRGVAYSTQQPCHVLNVPAHKISAFADDPHHFYRWLQRHHDRTIQPDAFVPRYWYGQYMQSILDEANANASSNVYFESIKDEALSIQPKGTNLGIRLQSGNVLSVNQVVLALGNLPPSDPVIADSSFYQSSRYVRSVWSETLSHLDPEAPVLLIGSGLTAIDTVLSLRQQGHRGTIHLVSRRGLLPQSHRSTSKSTSGNPCSWEIPDSTPVTIRALLKQIRRQVDRAAETGADWQSVIDALRPHTQTLWQALPSIEQQRFLRHVRPYWEIHRHRLAPAISQHLSTLIHAGIVRLHAARIQTYDENPSGVGVTIRHRGSDNLKTLRVQAVINCTGPNCDYCQSSHPLLTSLLVSGLVRSDALKLGLDVAENGAMIAANGIPSSQLYTLGSSCKGLLWETTAVPEIRSQASTLADQLLLNAMSAVSRS
jgi:uncharacterized NAD(P)/FAD-binding protein YdhS